MSQHNLLERRPSETTTLTTAGVAAVLIGVLNEVWGITLGPYTQSLVILVVGLVAPAVTGLVTRSRSKGGE